MKQLKKLDEFSLEELQQELKLRESTEETLVHANKTYNNDLQDYSTSDIYEAVREKQSVIYGTDDRKDIFKIVDEKILKDAESVVALFSDTDIIDNGDGTSTIQTQNFGEAKNLCSSEPFQDQPIGAFCTGFLVAPNIIATAGHCVHNNDLATIRFVFGFRMKDESNAETHIKNTEIYKGIKLIGRKQEEAGGDWALVQLDRAVENHPPVQIRRKDKMDDDQDLHVIGHPVGLPIKYAGGAKVRKNNKSAFFVADLDTYGGNSGSPVFNSNTHVVEGILVRGEDDFKEVNGCLISNVCNDDTHCRGEDCTRTTEIASHIPEDII
ncbi:serine protease [Bacillus clarus]|uniref:Serine protease n=1 Tax=Bacillus clarus TaxID=2338372 RepID=A0A090ZGX0_9BACI|nr:serine protease [Bacillus clarus]KFN03491.1 peptidase S7, Flavivirus NS3 serine protease family protein [Bacillus clarus]RFT66360.1 serine protease [Bacillus clarus]